jgi:hypothetical protein
MRWHLTVVELVGKTDIILSGAVSSEPSPGWLISSLNGRSCRFDFCFDVCRAEKVSSTTYCFGTWLHIT